jgi:hypothetical protein
MRTPTLPRWTGVAFATIAASLLLAMSFLPAGADGAISYTKEPYTTYGEQLAAGQIQEVTINKRLRTLRITLTDGRHVLAKYAAHEEPRVRERLAAKHIPVHVLSSSAATAVAARGKTKVHHKIRYIVGGVVIALVVIVGGVVFYNRRKRAQAGI